MYCYRLKQSLKCVFTQTDRRHHNILAYIPVWEDIKVSAYVHDKSLMFTNNKNVTAVSSSDCTVHDYLNIFPVDTVGRCVFTTQRRRTSSKDQ